MARIQRLCYVASLFVLLGSANAAVLTFHFSGNLTQVPLDDLFGDVSVGDVIQGSFTFDSSVADLIPGDAATGSYTSGAPFGMAITIGAHDFITSGSLNIGILNSVVDQYTVLANSASGDLAIELFLQDNTGTAFNNDHLPLDAPSLTNFTQKDFHLDATFPGGGLQADGTLSSLAASEVPEPSPSAPVLGGSIILLVLAHRKHLKYRRSIKSMSRFSWQRIVWPRILAAIPGSLLAVDGVVLIDQNRALAGNITAGDAPGFPVTISQSGSYKLSGNLTVPDLNTTAIRITADNVTLDLGGFSIIGPAVCTGTPTTCPALGTGIGVQAGADQSPGPRAVRVLNGSVRGFGNAGILLIGDGEFVQRVNADSNVGGGLIVAGTVIESAASHNGNFGILAITVRDSTAVQNFGDGIVLDGSGGVGTGNIASFNHGRGMFVPNGTATGNTVVRNDSFGISTICPSVIVGNTIVGNVGTIETSRADCVVLNNAIR